jgi:hypothetical protein
MTHSIRNHRFFVLIVITLPLLNLACSSPSVSHTSISGEVKQIEHWDIKWSGMDASSQSTIALEGISDSSKYTHAEVCDRYVEKVRSHLTLDYDFSFAENFPTHGTISIELTGAILRLIIPGRDTSHAFSSDNISPDGRSATVPDAYPVSATGFYLESAKDNVASVRVSILEPDGKLAGMILIGGGSDDNVKPEFVARVINELIRTGQYKGKAQRVES